MDRDAGTLVAMTRLADPEMTPPGAAMGIETHRALGEQVVGALAERAGAHGEMDESERRRLVESIRDRGQNLLDAWERLVTEARTEAAAKRSYSRFDKDKTAGKPLLYMVVDPPEQMPDPNTDDAKFVAPTSMRDVEETAHLWIERRRLGGKG